MGNGSDYYSNGKETLKVRIFAVIIFTLALVIFYSIYLYSIQVVKGSEHRERAVSVARRESVIPALRGIIYDRNYDVPLVTNVDSFAVDIIPAELDFERFDEIAGKLANILGIRKEDILSRISPRMRHQHRPVEIKDRIEFETILVLAENIDRFPGVVWRSKPKRAHYGPGSLSHILGYIGNISREELQVLFNRGGFTPNSEIGKMGIEREYDHILRGRDGLRYNTVDARGRKIGDARGNEAVLPIAGKNLVLTIDRRIQELSEKALGERIGTVVVMRPSTGEILAMVSYPWFYPNKLYSSAASQYFSSVSADTRFPFLNRNIQSSYSPGSVFKFITSVIIIEEELFPQRERIVCRGRIHVGDRFFHCHKRTGHGSLDLARAFAESCNIYYWTVGREHIGIDRIADFSRRFGLGQRTGIDIPGEVRGLVPTPEWKLSTFNIPWVGGDTLNISIGEGFLETTPLQLANAISMVVNEGVNYVPRLVKEIRDPVSGKVIESFEPRALNKASIRGETFRRTQEIMRYAVTHGTPRVVLTTRATQVAGKTGTSEVGLADRWISWFGAYAPYQTDNPDEQVVVVVMVEATNDWEWWAPKASNVIFQGIFANQTFEQAVAALNVWYLRP
ncbi:MAG: penicillin-binding protein 2 [Spirochaetaceae bacterium]|nr:penicillin-binding protein 2 [Spirochaetaceae bacterium]